MGSLGEQRHLEIVGAGPAGIAAALTARAARVPVTVYEKHGRAGTRFHGDFQGLENWTTEEDTLEELERLGVPLDFAPTAVHEIVCFDSRGTSHRLSAASRPPFYLVKRGGGEDSLDTALARQALKAGVTVRWSTRLGHLRDRGIIADGPHRADVIAVGHTFSTDMADGYYVALSEALAPAGYAYLLVHRGAGTVAVCLYRDFHHEKRHLERTLEFFSRQVGLRLSDPRPFGGSGSAFAEVRLASGLHFHAGESAGLQDPLFGFGLRYALLSGHFAAQAWLAGSAELYERLWRARLRDHIRAGAVNRRLYEWLGDGGRRWLVKHLVAGRDPRRILARIYRPGRIKAALGALLVHPRSESGVRAGCDCTWCRCRAGAIA